MRTIQNAPYACLTFGCFENEVHGKERRCTWFNLYAPTSKRTGPPSTVAPPLIPGATVHIGPTTQCRGHRPLRPHHSPGPLSSVAPPWHSYLPPARPWPGPPPCKRPVTTGTRGGATVDMCSCVSSHVSSVHEWRDCDHICVSPPLLQHPSSCPPAWRPGSCSVLPST